MVRVDLSDYGYVNARVRGMRSHLLTQEAFIQMVEAESFEALHSLLEQTVYRREVNEVVLMDPVTPDYEGALSLNLYLSFRKIHDATGGEAHRLIGLLLSRYDIQNLKTILRGKKGGATTGEIQSLLVPVGNLRMETLQQISQEREVRDVLGALAALHIKYGRPLLQAMPMYQKRDGDLAVLELALDKFHYTDVMSQLEGRGRDVDMTRQIIRGEINMRNISTLVRIRGIKLDDEAARRLMIPGGTLTPEQFVSLYRLGDVARMVEHYPDTRHRKVLERALEDFQELDVVAFDRELEHQLIRDGVAMSNVDVLGIGVIIGYVFSKQNEVVNLRLILKGKNMEQSQEEIKRNLFFVSRVPDDGH